jgi:hypothetical protein
MKLEGVGKPNLSIVKKVLIIRPKPSDLLWPDWRSLKIFGGSYVSVALEWESCE